jgi:hypothetical protein
MSELPKHLVGTTRLLMLRRVANNARGYFGSPVYLCGSALLDDNSDPRDWDLRVRLDDDDFAERYGNARPGAQIADQWEGEGATGEWTDLRWRWSDDCCKWSRRARRNTRLNVDFQVYPASYWDNHYQDLPRVRLDTREE